MYTAVLTFMVGLLVQPTRLHAWRSARANMTQPVPGPAGLI